MDKIDFEKCIDEIKHMSSDEIEANSKWFYENYTEKENIVRTVSYAFWLEHFLDRYIRVNDDADEVKSFDNPFDEKNFKMISFFVSYIEELAKKQKIKNIPDKENEFEDINYCFSIENNYYNVSVMVGQGTITFLEKLDKKPRRKCVVIPVS